MNSSSRLRSNFQPSIAFVLILALMVVLLVAGGASRADVLGQTVVRAVSWGLLIIAILFGQRSDFSRARPVLLLLLGAILLVLLQLIPLPPGIWQGLPGRTMLAEAASATGQDQPWRPLAIVPGAAINAASSLIVPFATLLFLMGLKEREWLRMPGLVLILIVASTLIGLLQFSGAGFNNPLVNDTPGQVSSNFANRNHLALWLAFGILLVPVWAFWEGHRPGWRGPAALGLLLLFCLTLLAIGSRAGLVLGGLALGLALVFSWKAIRKAMRRAPKWTFPVLIVGILGVIAIFTLIAIAADRAVAINRILTMDPVQDLRHRALPTMLTMIGDYFPWGSGFGGFDPVFRMHEPFELLQLNYLNHMHNDFLEIALDGGLAGVVLLAGGILWWLVASVRAWRTGGEGGHMLPRLGSAMILLTLIASIFDYPARTPLIMAVLVLAGVWLSRGGERQSRPPLPTDDRHL